MPRWFFPVSICCLFFSSSPPPLAVWVLRAAAGTCLVSYLWSRTGDSGCAQRRRLTNWFQCASSRRKKQKTKQTHTHTQIKPKESEVGTSRQPPSSSATKRRKCDASGGPSGATRYTASLQRTPPDPRHTGPLSADSTRTAERFTVRSYPAATGRCVRLHARSPDQTASGGICAFRIKAE